MKYIISVVLLCFAVNVASAQDVYTSTGRRADQVKRQQHKKEKGYDPSRLIVGGTFDLGFGGGYTDLGISPFVGYRITKNFSAGVGLGYEYLKQQQPFWNGNLGEYQNYPAQANIISPNVWAHYHVWRNLYVAGVFEYDLMYFSDYNYDINSNIVSEKANFNVPCLLLGPGYKFGNNRLSGYIEVLYDVLQNPNSPYFGTIVPRFGISVGI